MHHPTPLHYETISTPGSTSFVSPTGSGTPHAGDSPSHSPRNSKDFLVRLASNQATTQFLKQKAPWLLELPLVVLAVLVICICTIAAIVVVTALSKFDDNTINNSLKTTASLYSRYMKSQLALAMRDSESVGALFLMADTDGTQLDEFTDFCIKSQLNNPYFHQVFWLANVPADANSVSAFNQRVIENFTAGEQEYANYQVHPIQSSRTTYAPVLFAYPLVDDSPLGLDMMSIPEVNETLVLDSPQPSLTRPLQLSSLLGSASNGTVHERTELVVKTVHDSKGIWLGTVLVELDVPSLIQDTMNSTDPTTILVSIIDTTVSSKLEIISTTVPEENYASSSDGQDMSAAATATELAQWHSSSQFHYSTEMSFGSRKWTIYMTGAPNFVQGFQTLIWRRWVTFTVVIVFGVAASLFLLFFAGCVRYGRSTITTLSNKLSELSSTRTRMHDLIEQLSAEESRSRTTMSLLPLSVLLVSFAPHDKTQSGKIVFANEQFLQNLHFEEQEIFKGTIFVDRVFPQIDFSVLREQKPKRYITSTLVRTAFGIEDQCVVSISFLSTNAKAASAASANCIIVIDTRMMGSDTSDTNSDSQHISSPNTPSALISSSPRSRPKNEANVFASLWNGQNPGLFRAFSEFCQLNQAYEGILFWQRVQEFKQIPDVFGRVEKQRSIVHDFLLGEKSPYQLNLPSSAKVQHEIDKIKKLLGQEDVFDELLKFIMTDLRSDLFGRFLARIEHLSLQQQEKQVAQLVSSSSLNQNGVLDTTAVELAEIQPPHRQQQQN